MISSSTTNYSMNDVGARLLLEGFFYHGGNYFPVFPDGAVKEKGDRIIDMSVGIAPDDLFPIFNKSLLRKFSGVCDGVLVKIVLAGTH